MLRCIIPIHLVFSFIYFNKFSDFNVIKNSHFLVTSKNILETKEYKSFSTTCGHSYGERPPVYYFLLSGWIYLFGEQRVALLIFQLLNYYILLFSLYLLTKTIFGNSVAFLSALIFSFTPYYFINSLTLNDNCLFTIFIVISFYFLFKFLTKKSFKFLVLSALTISLSVLTRGVSILFVGLIPLLFLWQKKIKISLLYLIIAVFPVLIWTSYLYTKIGDFKLSDESSLNLWLTNNELFDKFEFPKLSYDLFTEDLQVRKIIDDLCAYPYQEREVILGKFLERDFTFNATIKRGWRKLLALFSLKFNPQVDGNGVKVNRYKNIVYSGTYLLYLLTTLMGLLFFPFQNILAKNYLMLWGFYLFSISIFTFLLYGHSYHRTSLDILSIPLCAYGLIKFLNWTKTLKRLKFH